MKVLVYLAGVLCTENEYGKIFIGKYMVNVIVITIHISKVKDLFISSFWVFEV